MHKPATVSESISDVDWMFPDVAVGRSGLATVAWGLSDYTIGTADSSAPRERLDPAGGADETYVPVGDYLATDAMDEQTLVYLESARMKANGGETFDVVMTNRTPGGEWSGSPTRVDDRLLYGDVDLAVNPSGAAVVMWIESRHLYALFRNQAGSPWSKVVRVPAPSDTYDIDVGIDDAGEVLVAGRTGIGWFPSHGRNEGVWAMRRTVAGGWGKPHQLSGPGTELFGLAVGAGGTTLVIHGYVDGNGSPEGPHFASRMSPDGRWTSPLPLEDGLGLGGLVDVDKRGHAFVAGWNGLTLIGRWSRGDGQWTGQRTVLATDVRRAPRWGRSTAVEVNPHGDAVVAWAAMGRTPELWARFKRAGQQWTPPVRIAAENQTPQKFRVAIGDCGQVAFTWITGGRHRELRLVRAEPIP